MQKNKECYNKRVLKKVNKTDKIEETSKQKIIWKGLSLRKNRKFSLITIMLWTICQVDNLTDLRVSPII